MRFGLACARAAIADYIDPAELQSLVERLPADDSDNWAAKCLRLLLEEVADEMECSNLSDSCRELAALGKRWRGFPEIPLGCDVLERGNGTYSVGWSFLDEHSTPAMIPCTLGDLLSACANNIVPAWFPLDWIQVFDESADDWRPRWVVVSPVDEFTSTTGRSGTVRYH